MRQDSAPSSLVVAIAVAFGLGGCTTTVERHFDPFSVNGRDGGGATPSYESLMRIGAAARDGGDYANAVGVFRRAAVLNPAQSAPLAAAGDALLDMAAVDEAIVSYNGALARNPHDPQALRGLGKAYLETGRPELAFHPLSAALMDRPDDPGVLQLLGVASDLTGQHAAAQERYRRGLQIAPQHRGLALDLALSLALTGDYLDAINILRPIATGPGASPQDRQSLALIYGLAGDDREAARLGRLDLDEAAVEHNLAYYATLRALSPEARERAIQPPHIIRQAAATSLP